MSSLIRFLLAMFFMLVAVGLVFGVAAALVLFKCGQPKSAFVALALAAVSGCTVAGMMKRR